MSESLILYPNHIIYVFLLISFNLLIIMPLGTTAIRAIVFPYSFWASENMIIGSNSIQYGQSFAALGEKCMVLMYCKMFDHLSNHKFQKSNYIKKKSEEYKLTPDSHSNGDLNEKMKSFLTLA